MMTIELARVQLSTITGRVLQNDLVKHNSHSYRLKAHPQKNVLLASTKCVRSFYVPILRNCSEVRSEVLFSITLCRFTTIYRRSEKI